MAKVDLQPATERLLERLPENGRRLHISATPIKRFEPVPNQEVERKPQGLWYGIDGSWMRWSLENYPKLGAYIYEVILDEDRIRKISTYEEFMTFEKYHGDQPAWKKTLAYQMRVAELDLEFVKNYPEIAAVSHGFIFCDHINYGLVAENFGGIEIVPFRRERHLKSPWYYGWDCASGCVWGKDAVKELRLFALYSEEKDDFDLQPGYNEV